MNSILSDVISLAKQAGQQILSQYHTDVRFAYKADHSLVTAADLAAHTLICNGLNQLTPEIPILSEELSSPEFEERRHWQRYWLVDPLDGTREFLEKNGEFTVNIALIEGNSPIFGVVYAPVFDFCYFAQNNSGAFKQIMQQSPQPLHTRRWKEGFPVTMAISRRHGVEALNNFFAQFSALSIIRCGSALKFCWLAEGFADLYPRFSTTCQWDTAAGQCILQEAGGTIIDNQGEVLRYNTNASLCQAAFLAVGDRANHWSSYLDQSRHIF